MTSYLLFVQAISIIAMAIDVSATLNKSDKKLVGLHCLGAFLFSIHFFLLGAMPGALTAIISSTRSGVSLFTKSKVFAYGFLALYSILIFIIPQSYIEALPFIAGILFTVGIYFLEGIKMRILFLITFMLWVIYSLYVFSVGGIILFTIMLITTNITIYRIIKDGQNA